MIKQRIEVANNKWEILLYYCTGEGDFVEIVNELLECGCGEEEAFKAADIVTSQLNTGLTFSNTEARYSFVCISQATSISQMVSTIVHELKHVQSHICEYYDVDESGEQAAYLIGYIARRVYSLLVRYKYYGRFQ